MPFTLTWTLAGDIGPGGSPTTGSVTANAMERASFTAPARAGAAVNTGVTEPASLQFLAVAASHYNDLRISFANGPEVPFTGPALMSGDLARACGGQVPTLVSVRNDSPDDAFVEVLVYRTT